MYKLIIIGIILNVMAIIINGIAVIVSSPLKVINVLCIIVDAGWIAYLVSLIIRAKKYCKELE